MPTESVPECFLYQSKGATVTLGKKERCVVCSGTIEFHFKPMVEWDIEGMMCGRCYSKKLGEHYPGEHVRINQDLE